jgi:hypothetical protein
LRSVSPVSPVMGGRGAKAAKPGKAATAAPATDLVGSILMAKNDYDETFRCKVVGVDTVGRRTSVAVQVCLLLGPSAST